VTASGGLRPFRSSRGGSGAPFSRSS